MTQAMEASAMPSSDEELARLLQFAHEPQSPVGRADDVLGESESSPRPHNASTLSDEALARALQDMEEEAQRRQQQRRRTQSAREQHYEAPPPSSEVDCLPHVADFLGSGAFFGLASALQVAVLLGFGNLTSCLCAALGCFVGHAAAQPPPRGRRRGGSGGRFGRAGSEEGEWEVPGGDLGDADHQPRRGLDARVIEGFTASLIFQGPARGAEGSGADDDNSKCMVCMEEYEVGDSLRLLPCLHRYHQQCIDEWLGRSTECPVCKRDITALALLPEAVVRSPTSPGNGLGDRVSRALRRRRS